MALTELIWDEIENQLGTIFQDAPTTASIERDRLERVVPDPHRRHQEITRYEEYTNNVVPTKARAARCVVLLLELDELTATTIQ